MLCSVFVMSRCFHVECESMDEEDDEDNTTTAMNGVVPENPDNTSDSGFDNGFKVPVICIFHL